MRIELEFHLFQDPNSQDVTIHPIADLRDDSDRSTRYGPIQALTRDDFRARGLIVVKEIFESVRSVSNLLSCWSNDNRPWWEMCTMKPRSAIIHASPGGPDATIHVVHYDDVPGSPIYGEQTIIPLAISPEEFALAVLDAFTKTRDFRWLEFNLAGARTFLCVYLDDRTGRYYWFDWLRIRVPEVDTPNNRHLLMTAWGYPQIIDLDSLRGQVRLQITQRLREFSHRSEADNLNPFPRGSQVTDADVADQKRVVIFQKGGQGRRDPRGIQL